VTANSPSPSPSPFDNRDIASDLATTPRGYSLNTKFIVFVLLVEMFVVGGGLYVTDHFLMNQRTKEVKSALNVQLELLSQAVELQQAHLKDFHFLSRDLDPKFSFQVITDGNQIIFDSLHPERVHTIAPMTHPLLEELSVHPGTRAVKTSFDFTANGNQGLEKYNGIYRSVLDHYFVVGAVAEDEIKREVLTVVEKFFILATFFCGISLLIVVMLTNRILKPIRELTLAAEKISGGEFDFALAPPSSDEIGRLSSSFDTMAKRVRELLREEVQKIRIKKEVSSVAQIQQSILPKEELILPRFEIQSFYQSASETGGDYWGYFDTAHQLVIYVADATGHGLSSAMLTAAARGCFSAVHRMVLETPARTLTPNELLNYAHEAVLDSAQEELNMTMFLACIDLEKKTLTFANAGHNAAWVLREESMEALRTLGPRLGDRTHQEPFVEKTVPFSDTDILFIYTDGLIDCLNPTDEAFGKNRLKNQLRELTQTGQVPALRTVKLQLAHEVQLYTQGRPLSDDITFAFLKLTKEGSA
jgi:serine phosphatase RsbU (regulator of sigma subunit)